ncbi:MAG: bifunctional sugar-1-phosphate nucleotidylyltransferase/acetyltransferase [Methermicoccaceae archaeon]
MDAGVLAGGLGTRMGPLSVTSPKPLLKIANIPLLQHTLYRLSKAGVTRFVVVVPPGGESVKKLIKILQKGGLDIRLVMQKSPRGTADALACLEGHIGESGEKFLVTNGDVLFEPDDVKEMIRLNPPAIALKKKPSLEGMGAVEVAGEEIKRIIEKPPTDYGGEFLNAGIYLLSSEVFDFVRRTPLSSRGEYELTTTLQMMIDEGENIAGFKLRGYWMDVGRPWDLLDANALILSEMGSSINGEVEEGAHLSGNVQVGEGSLIRSGAYIEGPVMIGKNCTVGPNCYIRPFTCLEDDVHIGNAVEVKNSIIGEGTNIGHLSYVGDSVIGKRCNFGAGTVVANLRHDNKNVKVRLKGEVVDSKRRKLGVIMGDDVHTGINTSINAGMMIYPHTTTLPGEVVVRNLGEGDV